jgi:HK97 gp10 family phage protein
MTTLKLTGVKECLAKLQGVTDAIKRKYLRIAMNAAGGQLKRAAVSRVPQRTKLLKQSMAVKVTQKKNGEWYVVVGAKRGMKRAIKTTRTGKIRALSKKATSNLNFTPGGGGKQYADPARYIHLAEKGTRSHYVSVKNKRALASGGVIYGRRVVVRAKPSRFLAAAAQSEGPSAVEKATAKLKQLVEAHK